MTTVGAGTACIVVSGRTRAALGGRPMAGLRVLVPAIPVRILAPQCAAVRVRPARMRTYVRARVRRERNSERSSRGRIADRGAPAFRVATGRRQPPAAAPLARQVGHLDRAFRSDRRRHRVSGRPARGDPRRALDIQPCTLKQRLYDEGSKHRRASSAGKARSGAAGGCALILDHINGVADDNRLENLRIVCPNCAATFDTHCGRQNRTVPRIATCPHCGEHVPPAYAATAVLLAPTAASTRRAGHVRWRSAGWRGRRMSSWSPRWRRPGGAPLGGNTG